jgi:hypothetical protein
MMTTMTTIRSVQHLAWAMEALRRKWGDGGMAGDREPRRPNPTPIIGADIFGEAEELRLAMIKIGRVEGARDRAQEELDTLRSDLVVARQSAEFWKASTTRLKYELDGTRGIETELFLDLLAYLSDQPQPEAKRLHDALAALAPAPPSSQGGDA